jgi:hypothetical protein
MSTLVLAGCALEVTETEAEEERVGVAIEAITNGTIPDATTNIRGGFLTIGQLKPGEIVITNFCSGTLITNTRLLTAKHCLTDPSTVAVLSDPSRLRISTGRGTAQSQTRNGKTIFFPASGFDYAVIDVSSPFSMPRNSDDVITTSGYQRLIINATAGTQVTCFGSGTPTMGTLRTANLTAQVQDRFFRYEKNSINQIMAPGDSGGGCVSFVSPLVSMWKAPLISIHNSCFTGGPCFDEAAILAVFDTWAPAIP